MTPTFFSLGTSAVRHATHRTALRDFQASARRHLRHIAVASLLGFCSVGFVACNGEASAEISPEIQQALKALESPYELQFTLIGIVDEDVTDSCYNIYLGDDFMHIDDEAEAIATVPIVNHRFQYTIPLKKLAAGRVRCVYPGNKLSDEWADLWFAPGTVLTFHVNEGSYDRDPNNYYVKRVFDSAAALREATGMWSPYLPKVNGKKWSRTNFEKENYALSKRSVREVIFGKDETILRITTDEFNANDRIPMDSYLKDKDGKTYKMKRAVFSSDVKGITEQEALTFGAYYAFEPMHSAIKYFDLHIPQDSSNAAYSEYIIFGIHNDGGTSE
ncbi:MAG: hypothetical protein K6E73_00670 [Bacteroidales bacterium]|nr:hypothetical protein [Bacteroidales bacterium]